MLNFSCRVAPPQEKQPGRSGNRSGAGHSAHRQQGFGAAASETDQHPEDDGVGGAFRGSDVFCRCAAIDGVAFVQFERLVDAAVMRWKPAGIPQPLP
jgi:hypothetical protein